MQAGEDTYHSYKINSSRNEGEEKHCNFSYISIFSQNLGKIDNNITSILNEYKKYAHLTE